MTRNNALLLEHPNSALQNLIDSYSQIVTLDANILLVPDRMEIKNAIRFDYALHEKYWLDSLFKTFPHLAIHQAVQHEILIPAALVRYINARIADGQLILLNDSEFTPEQETIRRTIERKISRHTNFNPDLGIGKDKGEVKSLAHIATRGYLYFCSADANAIRLIDHAESYDTNLDQQYALRYYELIFYLQKIGATASNYLKAMYNHAYRLTEREKEIHPPWGKFCEIMDTLYHDSFKQSTGLPHGVEIG